jgi:hypothetical protein
MVRSPSGPVASAGVLLLIGGCLTPLGGLRADTAAPPVPTGTYAGTVWSSGLIVPVITRFEASAAGEISGAYAFEEPDRALCGVLLGCRVRSPNRLDCHWQDAYGSGALDVTFAADGDTFTGAWSVAAEPGTHEWNGQRTRSSAELPCEFGADS